MAPNRLLPGLSSSAFSSASAAFNRGARHTSGFSTVISAMLNASKRREKSRCMRISSALKHIPSRSLTTMLRTEQCAGRGPVTDSTETDRPDSMEAREALILDVSQLSPEDVRRKNTRAAAPQSARATVIPMAASTQRRMRQCRAFLTAGLEGSGEGRSSFGDSSGACADCCVFIRTPVLC